MGKEVVVADERGGYAGFVQVLQADGLHRRVCQLGRVQHLSIASFLFTLPFFLRYYFFDLDRRLAHLAGGVAAVGFMISAALLLAAFLQPDWYQSVVTFRPSGLVNQREFGFGSFAKKIAIRHRGFKDEKGLLAYVRREAPAQW